MNQGEVLNRKYQRLKEILKGYGSCAVAFSSGVDSTFLLQAAREALGENVAAVTTTAPWFPVRESDETKAFCESRGIRHILVSMDDSGIPQFKENPPDRCYHCKKALFQNMRSIAEELGCAVVAEGSNTDDDGDYRPGHLAIRELGIRSPLREADLSKDDIRTLSKQMGLQTWSKPSFACLASRFPYGEIITKEKLGMVEQAEDYLLSLGYTQMRVRIHETVSGDLMGRIELPEEDIASALDPLRRMQIRQKLKDLGFNYIALDLAAYRTGRLNQTLDAAVLQKGRTREPGEDDNAEPAGRQGA